MKHYVLIYDYRAMGSEPIECCATSYLPVRRKRIYFGNIPLMKETSQEMAQQTSPLKLQAVLGATREAMVAVVPTITSQGQSRTTGKKYMRILRKKT